MTHLAHRTHAVSGVETLHAADIKQELDVRNASADHWPKSLTTCCEIFLERTRKKLATPADLEAFENKLSQHIHKVVEG